MEEIYCARSQNEQGEGGRCRTMARGWHEGEYNSLYGNSLQWFDDLTLPAWDGADGGTAVGGGRDSTGKVLCKI